MRQKCCRMAGLRIVQSNQRATCRNRPQESSLEEGPLDRLVQIILIIQYLCSLGSGRTMKFLNLLMFFFFNHKQFK